MLIDLEAVCLHVWACYLTETRCLNCGKVRTIEDDHARRTGGQERGEVRDASE